MKTLRTTFSLLSKDRYLRNDEKYQIVAVNKSDNIFSTPTEKNVSLSEIMEGDYSTLQYESGIEYKGIPTGQAYLDEDGDITDYQAVTLEDHPGRLKYSITNQNILISSLRLAKSPALMFEDLDLSEYVFSNGFYVFKVKDGWEPKFVLYVLRSKRIKDLLDNNLYRGIGISAYRVEDLLRCEIKKVSLATQKETIKKIEPLEIKIKQLKTSSKKAEAVLAGKMICTLIDYCLNPKLNEKINQIIGCGIGICTGSVLATKVGMRGNEGKTDVENETGIIWIGSCTNYASKYCGVANAGEIVIDKKTYSNITDNANWTLTQKIKGDVIYSCFVSQQNYMDIETDNEAICLGTDIVHSSVGVQINETILTNIDNYEKQIRELTKLSQELKKKQTDLSKKESELDKESSRQKQEAERLKEKEQRVNQEYYNNLARTIEDAHCKREYVIKCGEDFWDKQLEKTISAGEKIGKTKLDVEIELCYALEDIYENLNSWEKAYNYLCIQAEYHSWIHGSTVEKCIIESHCFARIKRIIEERLQPSVPYNLGKDLEECKEVIKKLGYWT